MIREVFEDRVTYGDPPTKVRGGTPVDRPGDRPRPAIDYVNSLGRERIRTHERGLLAYATDRCARSTR